MYYKVYVDVLFIKNLWMNSLLLYLTAWMQKEHIKAWRVITAAVLGSLGAVFLAIASAVLSGIAYFFGAFILAAVMTVIVFPKRKQFLFYLSSLYIEGFALNGILQYVEQFHSLAGFAFAVFSSISIGILFLWKRYAYHKKQQTELLYMVSLKSGAYQISVQGLYDTGNELYDPISGKAVSILSGEILKKFQKEAGTNFIPRMIPYQTISECGVLEAYTLDWMKITTKDGDKLFENPMFACMPTEKVQYPLILHRDLLPL